MGTRIGQKHLYLAIFHATGCPAILGCHLWRMLSFFEKSRLMDNEHGLGRLQMLGHIRAQIVAEGIGIPLRLSSQMLHAIGRRSAIHLRQWPAIFALQVSEQASDIAPRAAQTFAAGKAWQHMELHQGQPERTFTYRL